jgi:hypothetical protein
MKGRQVGADPYVSDRLRDTRSRGQVLAKEERKVRGARTRFHKHEDVSFVSVGRRQLTEFVDSLCRIKDCVVYDRCAKPATVRRQP